MQAFKLVCLLTTSFFVSVQSFASNWQDVIRALPYSYSDGFYDNLSQIRRWVLLQNGYCDTPDRHILFDDRGRFLTWMDNLDSSQATQKKVNQVRRKLQKSGKVNRWIEGQDNKIGYPFALNCNQPHADLAVASQRLLGRKKSDRLWGTWDGLRVGSKEQPVPLYQLVEKVYLQKNAAIGHPPVAEELKYLLGQIIIESGAQKHGLSKANAIGILQLQVQVLEDCKIPEKFYRHRMAQVDCAVRLFHQNRRNLLPKFNEAFPDIPAGKRDTIFSSLLTQSYHSGIGRIQKLLVEPPLNQATTSFAQNAVIYSAKDIATGIIYHNLGRENLGMASLYYVIDVTIAADRLCQTSELREQWFCQS